MAPKLDLVGIEEIAQRLGVPRSTVSQWQARGWPSGERGAKAVRAPKLLATLSGHIAVYAWADVKRWADATGRPRTAGR